METDAEWFECRLDGCSVLFQKRVHNQAFHDRECCRIFTNARILAAYHTRKNKVMKGRVCKAKGCATLLSRYNDDDYCSLDQQKMQVSKLEAWGWETDEFGQRIA